MTQRIHFLNNEQFTKNVRVPILTDTILTAMTVIDIWKWQDTELQRAEYATAEHR